MEWCGIFAFTIIDHAVGTEHNVDVNGVDEIAKPGLCMNALE